MASRRAPRGDQVRARSGAAPRRTGHIAGPSLSQPGAVRAAASVDDFARGSSGSDGGPLGNQTLCQLSYSRSGGSDLSKGPCRGPGDRRGRPGMWFRAEPCLLATGSLPGKLRADLDLDSRSPDTSACTSRPASGCFVRNRRLEAFGLAPRSLFGPPPGWQGAVHRGRRIRNAIARRT